MNVAASVEKKKASFVCLLYSKNRRIFFSRIENRWNGMYANRKFVEKIFRRFNLLVQ